MGTRHVYLQAINGKKMGKKMVYDLVRKVIKPSHRKVFSFSFSFRSILFRVITHNKAEQKERFYWKIVGDLFDASGFESKASMFSIKITQNMVTINQPSNQQR